MIVRPSLLSSSMVVSTLSTNILSTLSTSSTSILSTINHPILDSHSTLATTPTTLRIKEVTSRTPTLLPRLDEISCGEVLYQDLVRNAHTSPTSESDHYYCNQFLQPINLMK